jgi:hypothetical protein
VRTGGFSTSVSKLSWWVEIDFAFAVTVSGLVDLIQAATPMAGTARDVQFE